MSNRTIRIAELVQRELGAYLHTKYQHEAVAITVAGVQVAPDLKTGKIFFSILGDEEMVTDRFRWVSRKRKEIRRELAYRVQIKHAPDWVFLMDEVIGRGNRVLEIMDQIDAKTAPTTPEEGDSA
ncbi:MAG: ribosome-binding factor A [Verrucomicrobiia bacterium]|tara:strand:+ start:10570 stop:10944 length:375 start_codon:yes stop_codon:yes gene_type:complete